MSESERQDRDQRIEELEGEVQRLQQQLEEVLAEIERLKEALGAALRGGKRQATPFSKGERVANPKPPGGKPGEGIFCRREAPPDRLPTVTVEAAVPPACPQCGGPLTEEEVEWASTTGLPACPQPVVTRYRVPVCRCSRCGQRVRGAAAGLAPDQYGATAHRVGPGVKAAAHSLHYGVGVPVRRVPAVLAELTGVSITQGALTQDALRRAEREVGAEHQQLRAQAREAPAVYTDDTGWKVGGEPAHLMAFDTGRETVYQIRPQHRNEEVREVVPAGYGGVLTTDRGKSYDARELEPVAQQKCLSRLERNVSEVLETKQGRARSFGLKLKGLLHQGIELWKAQRQGTAPGFAARVEGLEQELTCHLRPRLLRDPDNQRLLDGIGLHHDRGNVLRFLHDPRGEPANNRAERILRYGVIARKVSHCSKNQRGAEACAAFTSVIRTAVKNGARSMTESLRTLFRTPCPDQPSP